MKRCSLSWGWGSRPAHVEGVVDPVLDEPGAGVRAHPLVQRAFLPARVAQTKVGAKVGVDFFLARDGGRGDVELSREALSRAARSRKDALLARSLEDGRVERDVGKHVEERPVDWRKVAPCLRHVHGSRLLQESESAR